jgi:hypothetical protein
VTTRLPGADTEVDSDTPLVDREPLAMTPPGATDRAAVLPTREGVRDEDELDVGMRLGERETLDSDPPELDDEELEPPLELEPLEPELPPELDPDDPELDDPELELPRGTACAPARLGAASATEMTRLKARRVDLAMVVTPRGLAKGLFERPLVQLYCHSMIRLNALVPIDLSGICPVFLTPGGVTSPRRRCPSRSAAPKDLGSHFR